MSLPASPLIPEFACATDVGRVRSHNEDALLADQACRLALLADGMGGYAAGEVASHMAIQTLHGILQSHCCQSGWMDMMPEQAKDLMEQGIAAANRALLHASETDPSCAGMGTTLVAVWCLQQACVLAHVGDSRAYLWREESLQRLTRDHSLVQQELDGGLLTPEAARRVSHRNLLTRGLGGMASAEPDLAVQPVQDQDLILLCSDGLTDALDDHQIARILHAGLDPASGLPTLQALALQLVQAANEGGGRDNISVLLVRMQALDDVPELDAALEEGMAGQAQEAAAQSTASAASSGSGWWSNLLRRFSSR